MIQNIGLMYTLILEPQADVEIPFQAKYNMQFTSMILTLNVSNVTIYVNDVLVFSGIAIPKPISIQANDNIRLVTVRDSNLLSKFELIGNNLN